MWLTAISQEKIAKTAHALTPLELYHDQDVPVLALHSNGLPVESLGHAPGIVLCTPYGYSSCGVDISGFDVAIPILIDVTDFTHMLTQP